MTGALALLPPRPTRAGYGLALLLFLGSATAVPLGGFLRAADIAFILAAALCARRAFQIRAAPGSPLASLVAILLVIMAIGLVSWAFQLMLGSLNVIQSGIATAIQIPGAIICALLIGLHLSDEHVVERCGQISLVFSLMLALMLFVFFFLPQPAFLQVDYSTTDRFSALSLNPNQLGLVLVPLPFFSYLAARHGTKSIAVAAFEIIVVIVTNYFSFGKTLFVAWIFFFVPVVFVELVRKGQIQRLLLIPAAIAAAPYVLYRTTTLLYGFYTGEGARGSLSGQGEGRLSLWTNGLRAWLDAPILGHGPGSFSGDTAPYQGQEAHNTIIDWMASFGIIGVVSLLALYVLALKTSWSRRSLLIIGLVLALATQAFTQFYGRSPYYWLWWILSIALAQRALSVAQTSDDPKERVGNFALT